MSVYFNYFTGTFPRVHPKCLPLDFKLPPNVFAYCLRTDGSPEIVELILRSGDYVL